MWSQKKCDSSRTKTHEWFLNKLKEINSTIIPLEEYKRHDIKIRCRCSACQNEWYARPDNLLTGRGCPECAKTSRKILKTKSHDDFVNEMSKIIPEITIIGRYTGAFEKIECMCDKHNELFYSQPTHLLEGKNGCKYCRSEKIGNALIKSHSTYDDELSSINPSIKIVGKYRGANNRIKVTCSKCGHEWNPVASSLLSGLGCPRCASSKGEKRIAKFLIDNGIKYESHVRFEGLKGVGGAKRHLPLSYDFYLPNYNLLIEYQGQFHDHAAYIQTDEMFEVQKEHDKRKYDYAKNNGILLLEIWYKDFDKIEEIMTECINSLKNPVTTTAV